MTVGKPDWRLKTIRLLWKAFEVLFSPGWIPLIEAAEKRNRLEILETSVAEMIEVLDAILSISAMMPWRCYPVSLG